MMLAKNITTRKPRQPLPTKVFKPVNLKPKMDIPKLPNDLVMRIIREADGGHKVRYNKVMGDLLAQNVIEWLGTFRTSIGEAWQDVLKNSYLPLGCYTQGSDVPVWDEYWEENGLDPDVAAAAKLWYDRLF